MERVAEARRGSKAAGELVTRVGSIAYFHREERPRLALDVVHTLGAILNDPESGFRPAAATSLGRIRNAAAAAEMAAYAERMGEPDFVVVPSAITAAGTLAREIRAPAPGGSDQSEGTARVRKTLVDFVTAVALNEAESPDNRGAACTSLGRAGSHDALDSLTRVLQEIHADPSPTASQQLIGSCVAAVGIVFEHGTPANPELLEVLRTLVLTDLWPPRIRRIAIAALNQGSILDETETLVSLVLDLAADPSVVNLGIRSLRDVRADEAARLLMVKGRDATVPGRVRLRALRSLAVLDADYDGDGWLANALITMASDPNEPEWVRGAACEATMEMAANGGLVARGALEDNGVVATCLRIEPFMVFSANHGVLPPGGAARAKTRS